MLAPSPKIVNEFKINLHLQHLYSQTQACTSTHVFYMNQETGSTH